MKKYLPFVLLGVFGVWVIMSLRSRAPENGFDFDQFGSIPALMNGRIQPLDSVARNSLLQIRSRATVRYPVDHPVDSQNTRSGKAEKFESMSPAAWLAEVIFNPAKADERRIFIIDHPELLSLLKLGEGKQFLSFNQLKPHFSEIDKQAERAQRIEPARRTTFEKQVIKLYAGLIVFQRLKNSLYPEEYGNFTNALGELRSALAPGIEAFRASQAKKEFNREDLNRLATVMQKWETVVRSAYPRFIPADRNDRSPDSWQSPGELVLHLVHDPVSSLPKPVQFYASMNAAYLANNPQEFNKAVSDFKSWLATNYSREVAKAKRESFFNNFAPFAKAREIYIFAFLLACFSLFNLTDWLRRSSVYLLGLAFILHTTGILFRMSIEGRPPVTNLYSSVVFVGWVVVLIGLYVEKKFPYAISALVASSGGFVTQIVAHYLSLSGDTMEVLRAVLDTNFWLATHVVTIAMGYGAVYFAGLFAVIYIILGVFTKRLTPELAQLLNRIVYGIMCFAILFSFLGTVLGGIWADQSWGRFWGWDPKENGALIIVLWTAIYLHARWGKLVSERGLMNMAVFGNIVTSWSWFGVNMLGVGLHSYGFMDTAAFWLLVFIASQLAIIAIGSIPLKYWKSFSTYETLSARETPSRAST